MNLSERPRTVLLLVAVVAAFLGGDIGRALMAAVSAFSGAAY